MLNVKETNKDTIRPNNLCPTISRRIQEAQNIYSNIVNKKGKKKNNNDELNLPQAGSVFGGIF